MNDDTAIGSREAAVTGSAGRALLVLGLVLEHGPVSPQRLTSLSGLSRTAVHRAIHALIDQGYVRYQLGKMHVIVTAELRDSFRGAFFSSPGIDPVSKAVDEALKHRRIQCEIAVLSQAGEARIVETTAPEEDTEVDFFESDLVSVLLSHFDPVAVTRMTARALRSGALRRNRTTSAVRSASGLASARKQRTRRTHCTWPAVHVPAAKACTSR